MPAPETELDLTLEFFANAGFNQVDAIGLTACGHTLGSVHHVGNLLTFKPIPNAIREGFQLSLAQKL